MTKPLIALVLVVTLFAQAQDTSKVAGKSFWVAMAATSAPVYADAYTTAHYVSHTRNCAAEGGSPWLYGRNPNDARVYAVMSGELAAATVASYFLKRHHRRWWMLPLGLVGTVHGQAAIRNAVNC